ncbi:alpha/beta fold hydrolase [Kitasatospora sp. NPDC085464]|uniref:alpha/beta fold hydrolase n=1 Tax=Kitasatospora sp. NPDC085464 TaxID=3364063 RepID=UPI0037CA08C8
MTLGRLSLGPRPPLTPGYPGIQPGPEGVDALRRDPSPPAGLGVREVFDHLSEFVEALDTKPIIMGHSFGGAFVQLLLDAGYGSAGVSIDGAAVKGVKALPFSEIKATFQVLKNPAFTNNLTEEESKAVYDRYSVTVSGRILFQGGFAAVTPHAATTYNFANDHCRGLPPSGLAAPVGP